MRLPVMAMGQRDEKPNGLVVYSGPSMLTGEPIVAVVTGLRRKSANSKTGEMLGSWILDAQDSPIDAVRYGTDENVCGDCVMRNGACYVNLGIGGPEPVFHAWKRGVYPMAKPSDLELFRGRKLRIGSFGDGTAVPLNIWLTLLSVCTGHTGYTHQHKRCDPRYKKILMASVETVQQAEEAHKRGWRTFRVRLPEEGVVKGEFECPASSLSGHKLTCSTCLACDGGSPPKGSVSISRHGTFWKISEYNKLRKNLLTQP